ncbi:hypothetical protein RRG08_012815 [Elysia crispata]|uniref:Uncharacterized protein n=1 Tax=Elysia crispata TaxID=231223 RepID=A0AAE1CPI1_9GAST|nr:hypothetical protein RRG08_012815 [Elysia crispata]
MAHSDDSTTIIVKIVVQSAQYVAAGDIYVNQQERLSGGIELGSSQLFNRTLQAVSLADNHFLAGRLYNSVLLCILLSCYHGSNFQLTLRSAVLLQALSARFTEILTYQDVVSAVRDELKQTDLANSDNSISLRTVIVNIVVQSAQYVAAGDIFVNQQERLSDYESLKSSGIRLQRTTDEIMTLNVESAKYVAGGNIHCNG